jgi:hypothetical protein
MVITNRVTEIEKFLGLHMKDVMIYRADNGTYETRSGGKKTPTASYNRLYKERPTWEET